MSMRRFITASNPKFGTGAAASSTSSTAHTRAKLWNKWLALKSDNGYWTSPWKWELALEFRIPAVFFLTCAIWNCKLYSEANYAWTEDGKVTTTRGKLLELNRHFYKRLGLPRYSVRYEYEVDGVKYTATRATTGSPYRNWMEGWYKDVITEAQYLQSIPIMRVGEPVTVYYHKKYPADYSALAHDGNSFEISFLVFLGTFPLIFGTVLKQLVFQFRRNHFRRRMSVKYPEWAYPDKKGMGAPAASGSGLGSQNYNTYNAAAAGASAAGAGAAAEEAASGAAAGENAGAKDETNGKGPSA